MIIRQPGDLWVLRGVIGGVAEEARTRTFASLTLIRFGFIDSEIVTGREDPSILGCT